MRHSLRAVIVEKFIQSKTGMLADCEDALYIGEHFIAAIDGATAHTTRRWDGKTGGEMAKNIIGRAFDTMPSEHTAHQAASLMTSMFNDFYKSHKLIETVKADPSQRISASCAAISLRRREVWLIGDCQCLMGDRMLSNKRLIDQITSEVRALCLEIEMIQGMSVEDLQQNEKGRKFIKPLLKKNMLFQNNPLAHRYWYSAVDGFPIPTDGIIIHKIPDDIEYLVLASDGYPVLKNSLEESEHTLHTILAKDPLLFREYKATKGKVKGQVSFDDRVFIKVKLTPL